MVPFCIAAFVTLYLVEFFWDLYLDRLNIKHMEKFKDEPPEVFKDVMPLERHQKSISYSKENSRFGTIHSIIYMVIFFAFVYSGGMNYLDLFFHGYIENEIYRGLAFLLGLTFLKYLMGLPFSYYGTFVIEEKFGFNKQKVAGWCRDQAVGLVLNMVILSIVAYAIFYFMKSAGDFWWLYAWAVVFLFVLLLNQLYHSLIAPLFNKFTPLEESSLRSKIEKLASKTDFPLENVLVMDATRRTEHSNAYFAGLGKSKRLVLYDTLIQKFDEEEIIAVVAHEIGHCKRKHLVKNLIFTQGIFLAFFYSVHLLMQSPYLYKTFLIENSSIYMGLILVSIVFGKVFSFLNPITGMLSWKFEFEADQYAFEVIEAKEAIKTLFGKLAEKNLSNLTPHPLYARFYYSHPPLLNRVEALGLNS